MKRKTLIALLCLFLSVGLAGFAMAGDHQQSRAADPHSAGEWIMTWIGSLVSQAQNAWSALQGPEPFTEIYRADTSVGEMPAPSPSSAQTSEAGADDDDDDPVEFGPMAEPFG